MKRTIIVLAAVLALAVSGGAYAAGQITGKQIRNNSITGKDIKGGLAVSLRRVEATKSIPVGAVDGVTVACPAGYAIVSGGFQTTAEVFYSDSFGATNSWSIGIDNFNGAIADDATAVAFCGRRGKAVAPVGFATRAHEQARKLIAARRASHG